ncbi:MAG: hypothetical protein HN406_27275, partial [Lentisphaerae bacterium]|nr:hypothetical protein [Lentisphaerota bacterium]
LTMLLCALAAGPTSHAANILINGDFEAPPTATGDIPGWMANPALQQQRLWLDRTEFHSGTQAAAIRSTARTTKSSILSQDVAVEPHRNYSLTLWARRDSFVYGTQFSVQLFKGEEKVGSQQKNFRAQVWRPVNMVFNSGEADRASVCLTTPNKGEWRITVGRTLWIDRVSLVPVAPDDNIRLAGNEARQLSASVDVPAESHYYLWTRISCAAGTRFQLQTSGRERTFRCYTDVQDYWLRPVLPEFVLAKGHQQVAISSLSGTVHEAILTMDPFWEPNGAPDFRPPAAARAALLSAGFSPKQRDTLPLTVQGTMPDGRWGITQGIPFAQGILSDARHAVVEGRPSQADVLTRWPDGSVKWLLLSTSAAAGETVRLNYGAMVAKPNTEEAKPIVVVETSESAITVNTGRLRFDVPSDGSALLRGLRCGDRTVARVLGLVNGVFSSANAPVNLRVEEAGPVRAVIRIEGEHRNQEGVKLLNYTTRVFAYAGAEYIELEHSFLLTDDIVQTDLKSLVLRLETASKQAQIPLGTATAEAVLTTSPVTVQADVSAPKSDVINYPFTVTQGSDTLASGEEANGVLILSGPGRLTIAVREFWQNAPKSMKAGPESVDVGLVGGPMPFYHGMAKTHGLLLSFADDDGPGELFRGRPLLLASPQWYCDSRALNAWPAPAQNGTWPGYEASIDKTIRDWTGRTAAAMRRAGGAGMIHYGDATYSKGGNNLESALGEGTILQFLRTGKREYFDLADRMIRHFADIDIDHSDANAGLIWTHGPHSRTTTEPGEAGVNGHSWYNGTAYYALFTGSRRILETADAVGHYYARYPFPRQPYIHYWRKIAWKLMSSMQAYDLTGNTAFLDAARDDVRITRYQRDHMIHLWPYMFTVGIKGLRHYHDATGDPEARELYLQLVDGFMRLRGRPDDTVNGEWPKADGMVLGNFPNDRSCCFYNECAHATWLSGDPRFARAGGRDLDWQITFGVADPTLLWGSADLLRAMSELGMREQAPTATLPLVVMSPSSKDSPLPTSDRPTIAFQVVAAEDRPFTVMLFKGAYRKYTNDYHGHATLFAPDGAPVAEKAVRTSGLRRYRFDVPADGKAGVYTLIVNIDDPWRWTLDQIDFELTAGPHTLRVRPRYDREYMDAFCLAKAGSYFPTLNSTPPPEAIIVQAEDGILPIDADIVARHGAQGGKAVRFHTQRSEDAIQIPFEIPEAGTYRFFARRWKGYADLLNVSVDDQPEALCKQTHDMDGNTYPAWSVNTSLGEDTVVPVWHPGTRRVHTYDATKLLPCPALQQ